MKRRYKKKRTKKMPSVKTIMFFTLITSIIVVTFSISKYETMVAGRDGGQVAKWDINLSTNYNDYILFENNTANEQSFTVTVKSESEVTSKYDMQFKGLYKEYNVSLEKGDYCVEYCFNENTLNIKNGLDEMTFDTSKSDENIMVNENNYYMEKRTIGLSTYINIINTTTNKNVIDFTINSSNEMEVIFRNCVENLSYGSHEDIYFFKISTIAKEIPPECNIKIYALFEQIN